MRNLHNGCTETVFNVFNSGYPGNCPLHPFGAFRSIDAADNKGLGLFIKAFGTFRRHRLMVSTAVMVAVIMSVVVATAACSRFRMFVVFLTMVMAAAALPILMVVHMSVMMIVPAAALVMLRNHLMFMLVSMGILIPVVMTATAFTGSMRFMKRMVVAAAALMLRFRSLLPLCFLTLFPHSSSSVKYGGYVQCPAQ